MVNFFETFLSVWLIVLEHFTFFSEGCTYCDLWSFNERLWKKNNTRGSYMRKYGKCGILRIYCALDPHVPPKPVQAQHFSNLLEPNLVTKSKLKIRIISRCIFCSNKLIIIINKIWYACIKFHSKKQLHNFKYLSYFLSKQT